MKTIKNSFVLNALSNKKNGYYLELGGYHSSQNSHTFFLEKEYDWNGLAIEIIEERQLEYSQNRKNPCILENATTFNYLEYFENNNVPKQIDFLSINIDAGYHGKTGRALGNPAEPLLGLIALPLTKYRFTVITFEHEEMQHFKNKLIKNAQREILDALGYCLVVRNPSEDWWIDPSIITHNKINELYKIQN